MRFIAIATVLLGAGLAGAQPANDDCANATPIGALPFSDAVDTTEATTEAGDPTFDCDNGSYGQEARSVWYSYTPSSDTLLAVSTAGSDFYGLAAAYVGSSAGGLVPIACNAFGEGYQSRLIFKALAGTTYYLQVGGYGDIEAVRQVSLKVGA